MEKLLSLTVSGGVTGVIFSILAMGLVLTYATTGIFNFAHGAIAFVTAYLYFELNSGLGWPIVLVAITVSWSIAMVRNQYGVHMNLVRVFVEGLQLPWLSTLGRMARQYAPWLEGRPSALPVMLFTAAVIAGIWLIKRPRDLMASASARSDS